MKKVEVLCDLSVFANFVDGVFWVILVEQILKNGVPVGASVAHVKSNN